MSEENKKSLIGNILVVTGKITKEQLDHALDVQAKMDDESKKPLGQILLELDLVSPNDIIEAIRVQVQMRNADINGESPSAN